MTKPSEQRSEIVSDDEVPAHLFEQTKPRVKTYRFEWGTSPSVIGGIIKAALGLFAVLAVILLAVVGLWLFLFLGVALGIAAAISALLFPTGRQG